MIAHFGRTLKLLILLLLSLSCKSFATIYYVNINNSTPGSGLTWATAFNDLNQALAIYSSGDQIWVAKGTYYPTTTTDRTATFTITNYLSLYGGFNGTETAATMANPTANPTILSGDIGIPGNAADNSYHVVTFTYPPTGSGLTMDGFTITGGNANQGYPASTTPAAANTGGGFLELSVNNQMQSATISHCTFTANFAVYGGGFGAYGDGNSSGTAYGIVYCTFTNNTAFAGGGVASLGYNNDYSVSGIDMCVFIANNSANNQGSAIATTFTNGPTGVMLTTVTNCVFYNDPQPQLYNQATNGSGSLQLYTSIIWTSGAPYTGPLSAGNSLVIDMCDVDLATPDGSNLDVDPQFNNPAAGDFHTPHCGPLVDQGFTTAAFNIGTTDPDGNPRLLGPKTDIGLYESQIPPAPTGPNVTYCLNAVASPLTATGANLLWYTTIGGTGSATAPTPVTSGIGSTDYYVTQTPAGSCESTPTTVTVTINPGATAPTATSPMYCQNAVAVPLTATGANLLWYTTIGGTGSATAPTPVTSGIGSTDYYVTQTPAGSCESTPTTITVVVNPAPSAEFTWSTPCEEKATTINAVSTTADQYTWDFGNDASVTGSGAGPYEVTWATSNTYTVALTTTAGGCQGQTQHLITVNPNPNVGIAAITVPLCQGNNISLEASGASSYQWSPATGLSNADIFNPVALLQSDIQYTVTGTDDNGCSATAQVTLEIGPDCSAYYIPNAFTPNGDGKNDEFHVMTADIPRSFTLIVFNRFGGKVFESANVGDGWNGSIGGNPASTGTYVYIMQATTSAGAIVKKQGTIMLIR